MDIRTQRDAVLWKEYCEAQRAVVRRPRKPVSRRAATLTNGGGNHGGSSASLALASQKPVSGLSNDGGSGSGSGSGSGIVSDGACCVMAGSCTGDHVHPSSSPDTEVHGDSAGCVPPTVCDGKGVSGGSEGGRDCGGDAPAGGGSGAASHTNGGEACQSSATGAADGDAAVPVPTAESGSDGVVTAKRKPARSRRRGLDDDLTARLARLERGGRRGREMRDAEDELESDHDANGNLVRKKSYVWCGVGVVICCCI